MPVRKIAISVPEDVLLQIDRMARRTKTTRSGLITRVLSEVSHASGRAEITERINRLFSDSSAADEQRETSHQYLRAAESFEDPEW